MRLSNINNVRFEYFKCVFINVKPSNIMYIYILYLYVTNDYNNIIKNIELREQIGVITFNKFC